MKQRDPLVDVVKGLGIVAVVVGHSSAGPVSQWLYFFHMPLFFVLSGILSRPGRRGEEGRYLRKKWASLMVPYFAWLVLFNVVNLAGAAKNMLISPTLEEARFYGAIFWDQLYGGIRLTGDKSVFWFVTCLFLTQQVHYLLSARLKRQVLDAMMGAALVLAWIEGSFDGLGHGPWSAEVCLYSLPLYHLGQRLGFSWLRVPMRSPVGMLSLGMALASMVWVALGCDVVFDMKTNRYGMTALSFLIALAGTTGVFLVGRAWIPYPKLRVLLAQLGAASMTIMFAHQIIKHHLFWGNGITQPWVVSGGVLVLSWFLHRVLHRLALGRRFFLGLASA
ncbi:MAG: acyltransferase family protein [Verrucomicrobiales bacterium]